MLIWKNFRAETETVTWESWDACRAGRCQDDVAESPGLVAANMSARDANQVRTHLPLRGGSPAQRSGFQEEPRIRPWNFHPSKPWRACGEAGSLLAGTANCLESFNDWRWICWDRWVIISSYTPQTNPPSLDFVYSFLSREKGCLGMLSLHTSRLSMRRSRLRFHLMIVFKQQSPPGQEGDWSPSFLVMDDLSGYYGWFLGSVTHTIVLFSIYSAEYK